MLIHYVYMLKHYVYMLYTHSNTRSNEIVCTARASIRKHYKAIVFVPNTSMLILIPKLVTLKLATSWKRVNCSLSKKYWLEEEMVRKILASYLCNLPVSCSLQKAWSVCKEIDSQASNGENTVCLYNFQSLTPNPQPSF